MRKANNTLSRELMNWKLFITVKEVNLRYEVKVVYKWEPYLLPDSIDILYECLLNQLDYKDDVAKVVYEEIEKEVNMLLREYQIKEAEMNCVQFLFPEPYSKPTIRCGNIWDYDWTSSRQNFWLERITADEYEELRVTWRLEPRKVYCVLNSNDNRHD